MGYNALVERLIDLRTSVEETTTASTTTESGAHVERGFSAEDTEEEALVARAKALSLEDDDSAPLPGNDDRDRVLAENMMRADAIEEFLATTASQLTATGLQAMRETMDEGEYCVWFRNNHFSVAHKRAGQLYTLVTDQGYLHEPDVVWETLGGPCDGEFVTASFAPFSPHAESELESSNADVSAHANTTVSMNDSHSPIPIEFLRTTSATETNQTQSSAVDADHALALKLQAQFDADERLRDRAAASAAQTMRHSEHVTSQRAQPQSQSQLRGTGAPSRRKKKSSSAVADACVLM
jgi:hypothetical protein